MASVRFVRKNNAVDYQATAEISAINVCKRQGFFYEPIHGAVEITLEPEIYDALFASSKEETSK